MAGEPSTQNTLDIMSRDMAQQEAMSLPRKRLTSNRISLTRPKKIHQDIRNTNTPPRGTANDPLRLIDTSFETMPPPRRRTVQLNEIVASSPNHKENIINSSSYVNNDGNNNRNELNRKRVTLNNDDFPHAKEPKLYNSMEMDRNDELFAQSTSRDDRLHHQELREAQELIQLYKNQLIEKTLQYDELLHARTTKQEEALENFTEWRQPTEEGYLALRDQVEEFLSKEKDIGPVLTSNHHQHTHRHQQQDDTAELKTLVSQLQAELEKKNAELKEKSKATIDEPRLVVDLYEDLTGVIVREIKKGDGTTAYKCVIAGKNGTFQFALSIGRGKNAYVYYSPSLDRQRDSRLLSTFPNFLKEEIEFERDNLPTFFSRLSNLLN